MKIMYMHGIKQINDCERGPEINKYPVFVIITYESLFIVSMVYVIFSWSGSPQYFNAAIISFAVLIVQVYPL
jgi:hypothetical protein